MSLLSAMAAHIRLADPRPMAEIEADILEELEFHIDARAADNVAAGMSGEDAREDACRRFGDVRRIARRCRAIQAGERIMLQRLQTALTLGLLGAVVYLAVAQQRGQQANQAALAKMAEAVDCMAADSRSVAAAARPAVVETVPASGDTQVDPALAEIRVVYDRPMMAGSWSWTQTSDDTFPRTTGEPRYLPDGKTCVLPVKLEAGRTYVIWLNSERFQNFRDAQGRPAVPYSLRFQTRK